ncbi:MAG: long-chain fatty acid--CoA ligase [Gammaproteobacteria bacterium]|nr:long-chain fatty acid--CoA ligase [Gammaproteobacteria bacterium]
MTQWTEDLISDEHARTLDGLFLQRVHRSGDGVAYRDYHRGRKVWHDFTWNEMAAQVGRWQKALFREGIQPGDRVALAMRNCPEWVIFDQACMGLGFVVVPLYTDDRPDNIDYILKDAAVKLLLVQDAGRWKRLAPAIKGNDTLLRVLINDPGKSANSSLENDERVRSVESWLPERGSKPNARKGDPYALASIVYTSGTTGRPKGVMLSHHNMLSVSHAALTANACYREDLLLSFLPLSHTLERTAGYYLPVMTGSTVAYARSIGQLAQDLELIRPTAIIAVPRVFERIYGRLKEQVRTRSVLARFLFNLAIETGWKRFLYDQGRSGWQPQLLLWPLLRRLVASKISAKLGGRLRIAVSGGAPLSLEIAKVFIGLGIPIIQGYGLTETSPMVSVNTLENNDPAGVGMALRGIDVKVGENDELLVKSPGVMMGYWNNHAATSRMIDSDDWLHTGDQARIENDHIYITGRIKDILVLSNGEKVPPGDMELAILLDPLFEQVMVTGEGEAFLSALVVLNADLWPGFAQDAGLDPMDPKSLVNSKLHARVLGRIRVALKDFPGFAKIRRIALLLEPWTVDSGLLTPTLKVKRAKVMERYSGQVNDMYRGGLAGGDHR